MKGNAKRPLNRVVGVETALLILMWAKIILS